MTPDPAMNVVDAVLTLSEVRTHAKAMVAEAKALLASIGPEDFASIMRESMSETPALAEVLIRSAGQESPDYNEIIRHIAGIES